MNYEKASFKEVKEDDKKYLEEILEREKENLKYDEKYAGWFCDDEPLEMFLFMEENTILNPKELMGYAEEFIENKLKLRRY